MTIFLIQLSTIFLFYFYWPTVFCYRSKVPCNRDTSFHLWIAASFPKNVNRLNLNLWNSSWPYYLFTVFPPRNSLSYVVFFVEAVARFDFLLTCISFNMLQNFAHRFRKVAMCNWVRYVFYPYTFPSKVLRLSPALTFKESYLFN